MKNQNDLIVAGAVVLVSIGVALTFFFTKREPVAFNEPLDVVTTPAPAPAASVVMAGSLPGGSTQLGGPGGGGGGRNENQPTTASNSGGPQVGGFGGPPGTLSR